jgi:hypothetical protein
MRASDVAVNALFHLLRGTQDRRMSSDSREPEVDAEQLERENARSESDRLPEDGAPGLGSSDGDVPPDAIRGPLGEGVTADDETEGDQ